MRVLWLCNIMLPVIANKLHIEASNKEGWLTGLSDKILKQQAKNDIELGVCFPTSNDRLARFGERLELNHCATDKSYLYAYAFVENVSMAEVYDKAIEARLKEIIQDFRPDVVHCFGTEYPHTLAMVRAFNMPERTLIGIQGLCSIYAEHFRADLPDEVWNRKTFRDRLKKDDLKLQQEKYMLRGQNEIEAIKGVKHITGRTHWDKHYAEKWNPSATYHFMNETLRANFYEGKWSLDACEKYSIFLSQGDYPIKGLHYIIKALPEILREYPDTQVYVAGNSIIKTASEKGLSGLKGKLKLESYGKYIMQLLQETDTLNKVHFLGRLNAQEMKERYLKSHVFLCSSSIENSPNSVGEAMLLGMPTVCADVGGISSIFHGDDGIMYAVNDTAALAKAMKQMFFGGEAVEAYCNNARNHAKENHDGEKNYQRLMEIYQEIVMDSP